MARYIGLSLAILGFLWISGFCALSITSGQAKYAWQCDQLDKEQVINIKVAKSHLFALALRMSKSQRTVLIPAFFMLIGAVLCLDKIKRNKNPN